MSTTTRNYDVIVVGGGVAGCSIAWRLSQRKRRVLLLEQRDICSGASGRNGGLTGEGSAMHAESAGAVYALTSENLRLMHDLPAELGVDFQLRCPGALDVATTAEQWEHLQEAVKVQRGAGLDVELLDAQEARALEPALTPDILGAKFASGHGHLWPFALVHGIAAAAARLGADIRTNTPVLRLVRERDAVVGVETPTGTHYADDVVLATNAYTPLLLPELSAGSIVPARGQILVTQPMAPMLTHPFGTNFAKEYGRQVPGGPILCGGFRRLDADQGLGHYEERVSLPVLSGIAGCLSRLYPALKSVQVVRCWAGIMGFTADGLPMIGRMQESPGLAIAAGFNGGGFSWTTITGLLMADLLTGKSLSFDLTPFRPERFADKGTAWSNPFTAGESRSATIEAPVAGPSAA